MFWPVPFGNSQKNLLERGESLACKVSAFECPFVQVGGLRAFTDDCPAIRISSTCRRSPTPTPPLWFAKEEMLLAYVYPRSGCGSRVRYVLRPAVPASCAHISCSPMSLFGIWERVGYRGPLSTILAEFGSRYGVIGLVASIPLQLDSRGRPSSQALLGRGFGRRSVSTGLYGLSYS